MDTKANTSAFAAGAVFGTAFVLAALVLAAYLSEYVGGDFDAYVSGAMKLRDEPDELYAWTSTGARAAHYIYPPFLAALIVPLTWLPRDVALSIWMLIELTSAGALLCHMRAKPRTELMLATAVLLVPLVHDLYCGQVNMLVLFCVVVAARALEKRRDARAGALLAVAALIKVLPILLLVPLLVTGRFRLLLGFLPAMLCGMLLPSVWLFPQAGLSAPLKSLALHYEYADRALLGHAQTLDPTMIGSAEPLNYSMPAVSGRIAAKASRVTRGSDLTKLELTWARRAGACAGLLMFGLAVLAAWRRRGDPAFLPLLGLCYFIAILSNVTTWHHHLSVLALLSWNSRRSPWVVFSVLVVVHLPYLLWAYPDNYPRTGHLLTYFLDWGISTALLAATALGAVYCYLARSDAQAPIFLLNSGEGPKSSSKSPLGALN